MNFCLNDIRVILASLLIFIGTITCTTNAQDAKEIQDEWAELAAKDETPEIRKRKNELFVIFMNNVDKALERNFDISGKIIGEDGLAIKGVRMSYSFKTIKGWETKAVFKRKGEEIVDSNFHIAGGPSRSAGATFFKEGYYDEWFRFSGPTVNSLERNILNGDILAHEIVRVDNLKLVMIKKGNRTFLKRSLVELTYNVDGSGEVLDYALLGSFRKTTRKVSDVLAEVPELKPSAMYIHINHDLKDKQFLVKSFSHKGVLGPDGVWQMPPEVRLVMGDAEGGFIPFDYDPDLYQAPGGRELWDSVGLQMRRAPENGYQKEWLLTPELLKDPPFFYCKIQGMYGRGRIRSIQMSDTNQTVTLTIEILTQPDKSQNLETGGWM